MEAIPGSQLSVARGTGRVLGVWGSTSGTQSREENPLRCFLFPPSVRVRNPECCGPRGAGQGKCRQGWFRGTGDVPIPRGGPGGLQDTLNTGKNVLELENDVRGVLRAGHRADPGLAGCAEGLFLLWGDPVECLGTAGAAGRAVLAQAMA